MSTTLRDLLRSRDNDYSALEQRYREATGGELVTDPWGSFGKNPSAITLSATVLIGSHDSCWSLERSLVSIGSSSFARRHPGQLDVVLVDDGSTDGTREMVERLELGVPLTYVRQERDGLTRAHNTGLAFASGDVVIFSDSDMVHTPYALEELMKRHQVLEEVVLCGFRCDIERDDPRLADPALPRLGEILPEFRGDFRTSYPGRPENVCRDTRHWKDLGRGKRMVMANGAPYDLPAMVVGAFFSLRREDYLRMGGSEERLTGWGCEDSLIGARALGLGCFVIPVYSAASAHIAHPRREAAETGQFEANIRTANRILDEPFAPPGGAALDRFRARALEVVTKPAAVSPEGVPAHGPVKVVRRRSFPPPKDPHPLAPSPTRTPTLPGEGEPPTLPSSMFWVEAPPLPGGRECGWERGMGGEGGRPEAPTTMTLTGPWVPAPQDLPSSAAELGRTCHFLGRFPEAAEHFAAALRDAPDDGWLYHGAGKTLARLGRFEDACEAFAACLRLQPDNPWAWFDLALARAARAHYGEARQALASGLAADPGNWTLGWALHTSSVQHKERGDHYAAQGDWALAVEDYELALVADPQNPWAHYDRGTCLRRLGRLDEALQSVEEAERLLHPQDGNRTWVHTELGRLHTALGNRNRAKLQLERALRLFRNNTEAAALLADLTAAGLAGEGLLCHLAIVDCLDSIPGWLSPREADHLIAATLRTAALVNGGPPPALVEVGSFCGKSTVAIGLALRHLGRPDLRLHAIDPHSGYHFGGGIDTYPVLLENLRRHGLEPWVEVIRARSTDVAWEEPIGFLFIDGLHDYENVRADFAHFAGALVPGALVAFHDYEFPHCDGVKQAVDELMLAGRLEFLSQGDSLILLRHTVC